MTSEDRRRAARANQRAAAFTRFQLLGDHEAMHYVLSDARDDDAALLAFVTALASIAGALASMSMGRERALEYLRAIAENSAALSDADDIDKFFDGDK